MITKIIFSIVALQTMASPAIAGVDVRQHSVPKAYDYKVLKPSNAIVHIVSADLTQFTFSSGLSPFYNALAQGPEKVMSVKSFATRGNAKIAINGTFFDPNGGYPIGVFVFDGKHAWSPNETLLAKDRSYLAFTDKGRLVFGNSKLSGVDMLAANAKGSFDPGRFRGEKIVNLISGFGWWIEDGDGEAWKKYKGKQFGADYYAGRRARSLVGADASGKRIFIVAQEERSNSSVRPLTIPDLVAAAQQAVKPYVIHNLVFLDGGSSTNLVVEGKQVTNIGDGTNRNVSSAVILK